MATFATPEQMANRTQGAITATSHPFLKDELAAATRAIRDACGWHIAPPERMTYRHVRPWSEQVWLPAMEIESIDSVTVDGKTIDPADVRFDPNIGWTSLCGCDVEVRYTAGFENVPEGLVQLALKIAAAGLGTSLGQTREQAGSVAITYGSGGGALQAGAGGADAETIAPYRIGPLP